MLTKKQNGKSNDGRQLIKISKKTVLVIVTEKNLK